ncbi:MAG TPA: hypothetical protein VKE69_00365 [Planctomycetota bacterium]|nr:hypothetical protein [Planctomycetota bacterium]
MKLAAPAALVAILVPAFALLARAARVEPLADAPCLPVVAGAAALGALLLCAAQPPRSYAAGALVVAGTAPAVAAAAWLDGAPLDSLPRSLAAVAISATFAVGAGAAAPGRAAGALVALVAGAPPLLLESAQVVARRPPAGGLVAAASLSPVVAAIRGDLTSLAWAAVPAALALVAAARAVRRTA